MEALGLRRKEQTQPSAVAAQLETAAHRLEQAQENLARLQLMMEDTGWDAITGSAKNDF